MYSFRYNNFGYDFIIDYLLRNEGIFVCVFTFGVFLGTLYFVCFLYSGKFRAPIPSSTNSECALWAFCIVSILTGVSQRRFASYTFFISPWGDRPKMLKSLQRSTVSSWWVLNIDGWSGRIRTYGWEIQSLLPYHLATLQNDAPCTEWIASIMWYGFRVPCLIHYGGSQRYLEHLYDLCRSVDECSILYFLIKSKLILIIKSCII